MKKRLQDFEATIASIKPFLPQYLESLGIDTTTNFTCINPDHNDENASMTCQKYPESAYCFGCHMTCNIFEAAHILESKPKKGPKFISDNLMYLADKFGVNVQLKELTQEELYEARTYKAYELAAKLVSNRNFGDYSIADTEIERREWDKEKVASWGIGTADARELKKVLKQHGYEPKFLASIDLDNPHIFSENNLIFTVHDEHGRPVGFSAKKLKRDKNSPKYINTRETGLECAIFKKSSRLYGFDIARDVAQPLYIFEGQANVITARHYGLFNTCCTLGSAFSDNHVRLLKRTGNLDIIIVYDGDPAGEEATIKILDERFKNEKDFRIKIVQMPNSMDPDDLIRDKGIDSFLILKKWHAFDWRSNKIVQSLESSDEPEDEKRKEIAEALVPLIVSEENSFDQEAMASTVARLTGYDKRTVLEEVKRRQNQRLDEYNHKKINLIESHMMDIRKNPEDADIIIGNIQLGLESLNKSYENDFDSLSTTSILNQMKRKDESKTGEFEGYLLDKLHMSLGENLNGDWVGQLFYIAGTEQAGKSTLACQMAVEIAKNTRNNAMCIFHSIDDSGEDTLYKMLCLMDETVTLKESWIKNPKYHMGERPDVFSLRDSSYKKLFSLIQEDKMLVRDIKHGSTLAYQESLIRKYREKYPDREILFFIDNFHCLQDFGTEKNTADRTKKISNYIKAMAVKYKATFICTAEYSKSAMNDDSGQNKNSGLANSRALQYDANVILHLVNDLHLNKEEKAKFVWIDSQGNLHPRIVCHIGKNKISGIEKTIYFDLYGANRTMLSVEKDKAIKDVKERKDELGLKR